MSNLFLPVSLASLVLWTTVSVSTTAGEPKPRTDAFGDLLPDGALARLGTSRFRLDWEYGATVLSPDGKLLACVNHRDAISLIDATSGHEVRRLQVHVSAEQGGLTFSPDGRSLVVSGFQGSDILDVNTGRTLLQLERNSHIQVPSVSFSRDGKLLALGAEGHGMKLSIRVWNLETRKQVASLETLHDWQVNACLSPDGKLLASWGRNSPSAVPGQTNFDQIIQLWDVAAGKELR